MPAAYKDYYKVLGVDKSATEKDIKSAFRRLARKHHPDVNPNDKSAEERFKEISEAYEVLGDKEKRAKYDQFGQYWEHAGQAPGGPGAGGYEGFNFDFGGFGGGPQQAPHGATGFSDFFEMLFGGMGIGNAGGFDGQQPRRRRATHHHAPTKGRSIEAEMEVSLEDVFSGSKKTFNFNGKRLEVTIPKGIGDGQKIRLAQQGESGAAGSGDLLIKLKIRQHPIFERKGDDLFVEVPVDYADAALGGEVCIPTLSGRVTMKVPADTQGGKTFRLPGQGMPKMKAHERGNLYAKVRIVIPDHISEREKELLNEIKGLRQS